MNSRDQSSLIDIITACQLALEFIDGLNQSDFTDDRKTQSATLYQLAIIGEAVKRLSPEFREQHPAISWRAIAGMRNKLVHDYEGVDPNRIWLTLQTSIPELLSFVTPLLPIAD
jgi:uncharacterized protein with HEPN domain